MKRPVRVCHKERSWSQPPENDPDPVQKLFDVRGCPVVMVGPSTGDVGAGHVLWGSGEGSHTQMS